MMNLEKVNTPDVGHTQGLKKVLADTFVLYMKTYAVHWNYQGSNFFSVHQLTENQYKELAESIDDIAERIRAKGETAPVALSTILESSDLVEMKEKQSTGKMSLQELLQGHERLATIAKEVAEELEDQGDIYTVDLLTARVGSHEKAAWMLRSFLEGVTPTSASA